MTLLSRWIAIAVAVGGVLVAACGTEVRSAQYPAAGDQVDLVTSCGPVVLPLGTENPVGEPVDAEAVAALDEAGEAVAAEWFVEGSGFGGGWTWLVAERDDRRIVFLGESDRGYAYAEIERAGETWHASGWGGCQLETEAGRTGYAVGLWVLNPDVEPDPASSTLNVLVMERSCANGAPPAGRDIVPVVEATSETVTITVIIENVPGFAECPGNPWYPTTFELGEPLGDRALYDGFVRPPQLRPWPPSDQSLEP